MSDETKLLARAPAPQPAGDGAALLRELRDVMQSYRDDAVRRRIAATTGPGVLWDWGTARAVAEEVLRLLARAPAPQPAGAEAPAAPSDAMREQKDAAYRERDHLVCALSKVFPAFLARHPDSDTAWDADWRWIVFVELPTGQASWHIHDSERAWFDHLAVRANAWDGHTTEEKYRRLMALAAPAAPSDAKLRELQAAWRALRSWCETGKVLGAAQTWDAVMEAMDKMLAAPPSEPRPAAQMIPYAVQEIRRLRAWLKLMSQAMLAEAEKSS